MLKELKAVPCTHAHPYVDVDHMRTSAIETCLFSLLSFQLFTSLKIGNQKETMDINFDFETQNNKISQKKRISC
jgi:hypothetical protein